MTENQPDMYFGGAYRRVVFESLLPVSYYDDIGTRIKLYPLLRLAMRLYDIAPDYDEDYAQRLDFNLDDVAEFLANWLMVQLKGLDPV
jgi:hypothetical protein